MELFCEVCTRLIIEGYTISNPNIDGIQKILNEYVTSHNKSLYIYAISCKFYLVFDNKFKTHIKTYSCLIIDDITKLRS